MPHRVLPRVRVAALLVLTLAAGAAQAQSLEETYANLCADAASAKTEACVALRQALLAKLTAEDPGAAPAISATDPVARAAAAATSAATQPDARERFGILGELVGTEYVTRVPPYTTRNTYEWVEPGRTLVMLTRIDGHPNVEPIRTTTTWDPATGRLLTASTPPVVSTVQPDGSLVSVAEGNASVRTTIRRAAGGVEIHTEEDTNGRWTTIERGLLLPASTPQLLLKLLAHEGQTAQEKTAILVRQTAEMNAERARKEAERRAAKKSSGWGGALAGAIGGLAAAAAVGGDAELMLSAASKGASMFSDNPGVQAMAQGTAPLLNGGSAGGMTGGAGSGGSRASFPTKPNLATSACSGFTESNYRTRALEGGNDVQLKTACGQAFEYYTMYKRAIAQGYSEADCNRTYAAHEQSAQVAAGLARN